MCDHNKFSLKDKQDYAWNYFQLHAEQRLKTFHFYIIIMTLLIGAIFTLTKVNSIFYIVPIGLLITFFSFIFWKLDLRNKELIHNAETHLKDLEKKGGIPLFIDETKNTDTKDPKNPSILYQHYTFSKSFNLVFFSFSVIGMIVSLYTLIGVYKINNFHMTEIFYLLGLVTIIFLTILTFFILFNRKGIEKYNLRCVFLFAIILVFFIKILGVDKYITFNNKTPEKNIVNKPNQSTNKINTSPTL